MLKLKKPTDSGFLDYTTLRKRRRAWLENAVSVAGVPLTAEVTLTEIPEPKAEHAVPAGEL